LTDKNKEKLHCYFRISSRVQEEGSSLETQQIRGKEIAKQRGLEFVPYMEGTASSNSEELTKRPQLQRILLGINEGKIKHLYAWDMDRLSRNKKVSSLLLMEMEENQVTFYTDNGVVDTSVRDDMLMLEIKRLFASHDNALRTTRMKQNKLYKIKKEGIWGGGQLPYGYTTENKKLTPEKEESKWVKKMFKWYYDGKPIIWIKQQLDKNNVVARRGGLFSTGSIMRLFQNTHYVGYYKHTDRESEEVIDLTCPSIVDESIWNKVQEKVRRNKDRHKQVAKTKNFYLIRHLLYCDHCGSAMHGRIKEKKHEYFYYCPKKQKDWKKGNLSSNQKWVRGKIGEHGCDNVRSMNIHLLDSFVVTKVRETLANSHQLKETFKKEVLKEKQVGDNDSWEHERLIRVEKTRRTHLEKQVEQLRSSLAEIETNILVGDIDDKELSEQIKGKVIEKFKDSKQKLDQSRQKIIQLEQENSWIDWLSKYHETYLEWEKFSKEELQDALNNFVDKVTIRYDHEKSEHIVSIKFKLPLVNDKIKYKDLKDKGKGYQVSKGKDEVEQNIPIQKLWNKKGNLPPLHHHSTVSFVRCRGGSLIEDTSLYFTFDLITRSSSLNHQYYSEYQTLIHDIISDKLDKGMNYKEIADWLNENGYLTVRGKRFRNAHTHSIVKKKKMSDDKHNRMYPSSLTNCSLEVTDKRLVNS
jgi:DNA invertase Pin-like site-specific DNA recombinase/DNA-binding transcriptional MerR regulator